MAAKFFVRLVAALPMLAWVAGCSSAYHRYGGCQIDCQYCPPPPLPYTHYDGCACHSCVASQYLSESFPASDAQAEAPPPAPSYGGNADLP